MFGSALKSKSYGFTLVEILIVVSIISVLSAFLVPGFSNYTDGQNIKQGVEILKSDLRTAQNKALTGVSSVRHGANYWGIWVTDNNAENYQFFYSTLNSSCSSSSITVSSTSRTLVGGVVIRDELDTCVFFSTKNGGANIVGDSGSDGKLHIGKSGDSYCEGVEINSAGMIRAFSDC